MRLKTLAVAGVLAMGLMVSAPAARPVFAQPAFHAAVAEEPVDAMKEETRKAMGTAAATVIIFICLFAVLAKVAWKPILSGLKARETAIREGVEAAAQAREEAERTTKELEAKIAEAQKLGQQQLMQAKADAQKLGDAIKAQAETEAASLRDRALREIDGAKQAALAEINNHAAELGTAIAQKILKRAVTVEDQGRLVEESLAEMAAKN